MLIIILYFDIVVTNCQYYNHQVFEVCSSWFSRLTFLVVPSPLDGSAGNFIHSTKRAQIYFASYRTQRCLQNTVDACHMRKDILNYHNYLEAYSYLVQCA